MFSPKERDAKRETVERLREWRHWRVVAPGKGCCWLAQAGGVESSRTPEATFRNRRGHQGEGPRGDRTGVRRRLGTASCARCAAWALSSVGNACSLSSRSDGGPETAGRHQRM
jgi:hypothetical protein